MESSICWDVLEIAPTGELALIRRAYAARLKAIDIERDPKAFIALREAYDAARTGIWQAGIWLDSAGTEDAPFAPVADLRLPEMDAIEALLHGDAPREAIFAALAEQTELLVARCHDTDLAQSLAIESWIADAIVEGIPRSNGMLQPAIAGLGWEARGDDHDCPYAIIVAVDRHRDAEFLRGLQDINPHYRLAWIALTEDGSAFDAVDIPSMTTLLGIVQHQRPGLFEDLDTRLFERWIEGLEERHRTARRATLLERMEAARAERAAAARRQDAYEAPLMWSYFLIGTAVLLFALYRYLLLGAGFWQLIAVGAFGSVSLALGMELRSRRSDR